MCVQLFRMSFSLTSVRRVTITTSIVIYSHVPVFFSFVWCYLYSYLLRQSDASWRYSTLNLECHYSNLKTQSIIYFFTCLSPHSVKCYGVATISRRLKITGLFCRISFFLQGSFAKETYHFQEPTNRSHPISIFCLVGQTHHEHNLHFELYLCYGVFLVLLWYRHA